MENNNKMEEFSLETYLSKLSKEKESNDSIKDFANVLKIVEDALDVEWQSASDEGKNIKIEQEKRAIMGYQEEMEFYKEKIKGILGEHRLNDSDYPRWFPNLVEAVFAELYGLSGLAPWAYDMEEKYRKSSSAKLIGDRLYCLIDGVSTLQPQRIGRRRREQLKRTLLLASPKERLEYGFHEVYLRNGIRITIYSGDRTKDDQDIMVFRKYVLENADFDSLARLGTIPFDAIEVFKIMVKIGFNVLFCGQVRSGKTTFLQVWQSYEDEKLEGVALATDPETPWHKIMPNAPIMQIIADGKQLATITKSLLRGDNDYVLLEEMRDAAAFKLGLDIVSMGTRRCKATVHDNTALNVPFKMAREICDKYGGDINRTALEISSYYDYGFELCQDPSDKSKKILKGIVEFSPNESDLSVGKYICNYDFVNKRWIWNKGAALSKITKYPDQKENIEKMIEMINLIESR